jgi:hypothetical protein
MVMGSSGVAHAIVALLSLRLNFKGGIVQLAAGRIAESKVSGVKWKRQ